MNKDLGTTILGGIVAAATGAMPVVEVTQGNWNGNTISQLVAAIGIALFGWMTNKGNP